MDYDFKRLEALIVTETDHLLSECVRDEYHEAIDRLMSQNTNDDLAEMGVDSPPEADNIESYAMKLTEKRMHKYGVEFFNDELERLMDKYNDDEMDKNEYLIRCEVLSSVTISLKNFSVK
jgi:hypothetical protein